MATPQNKPRRPSLQINTTQVPTSKFTAPRKIVMVDPKDPTAFNTLSNVYATVIDRKTPIQPDPVTAVNTRQPFKTQTDFRGDQQHQPQAYTPYITHGPTYPDTPLTAHPKSPMNNPEFVFPSAMTSTPPLSAGPVENNAPTFTFTPADMSKRLSLNTNVARPAKLDAPLTPHQNRPTPTIITTPPSKPPYTHPRTLHSILRNSPLPPATARQVASPRRQSVRLQQKAAKRVGYNNPLTQTIVNSKYVFSHVDLLTEDISPSPISPVVPDQEMAALDTETSSTDEDTRDGGMTPGPLEDMRRKMAGLGTSSPLTGPGGIRKRKKKEKKRQWTWTINTDDDPDDDVGGAIAAIRAAAARAKGNPAAENPGANEPSHFLQPTVYIPDSTPSLCSQDSEAESQDVEMSDSSSLMSENSSRAVTPSGMDLDDMTPLGNKEKPGLWPVVVGGEGFEEGRESGASRERKDTPVPPDLAVA
ncbi:related to glucan 1,4-alpha-glucosidase [Cephalotrichum gorgonifer]|uniref:Related to glucan 1,4-alpha-glucosidase n=1 Tax=Cephalotrichum gorgonifer TaxID=2041049 RepID=A0AAE8N4X8_9PEZI|nr:related to glucan 1,4-alpha-glucosidase [Cephalotrichum gorgonifer]